MVHQNKQIRRACKSCGSFKCAAAVDVPSFDSCLSSMKYSGPADLKDFIRQTEQCIVLCQIIEICAGIRIEGVGKLSILVTLHVANKAGGL